MTADPFAPAQAIADAVLWEGYVLYPYRAGVTKNRMRWQFGVLVPPHYAQADGFERAAMTTECIADPGPGFRVAARVRFLQCQRRQVEVAGTDGFTRVDEVDHDGHRVASWDEGVPQSFDVGVGVTPFALSADHAVEYLDPQTRVVRTRAAVTGVLRLETKPVDGYVRVCLTIENTTDWGPVGASREEAIVHSAIAAHAILHVDHGRFVSSLDPPTDARAAVEACVNDGAFPVLAGDAASADLMLASPIILYDHPEVAPRSPGAMFDGTEIDEMLSLRVMTLTPDEKEWARDTDPLARALVDRVETLTPDALAALHADMLTPQLRVGSRVRLQPSKHRRTDAQDMLVAGMSATVKGMFEDLEGAQYIAVVVDGDDDYGRYRYFYPDEIELV
ncbi:MAG TPA: hypothetical protein VHD87_09935 [Acidimicrobiales bacterium]|nr:hypothetical protein [Acidimicrobiales bacterium]